MHVKKLTGVGSKVQNKPKVTAKSGSKKKHFGAATLPKLIQLKRPRLRHMMLNF